MTAKEYCLTHKSIGYISALNGVEIKGIMPGITEIVYAVSGAWCSRKNYHCVRVFYTTSGRAYIRIANTRLYLDECIRM